MCGAKRGTFDLALQKFRLSRPTFSNICSTRDRYTSIFSTQKGCFDSLDQNRVFCDYVLDLKLLFDCGTSVAILHLLDFQSQNIT